VIRIDVGPRLRKAARALGPEATQKVQETLQRVADAFGDPHRHAGTGLRKLGRRSYEARVWLHWRIVFIHEGDRLTAYDLMNHDQVTAWLKGRRGE
jgi:hypothetical protein